MYGPALSAKQRTETEAGAERPGLVEVLQYGQRPQRVRAEIGECAGGDGICTELPSLVQHERCCWPDAESWRDNWPS